MTYEVTIRRDIREHLDEWARGERVHLGSFLTAVLSNNLTQACGRADDSNLRALPDIVRYCYNELPSDCWGSPEKVEAWRAKTLAALPETAGTS